ncbi:endonuclease/exonuclease/phosphatase family protein [Hyphococcus sp.]|jgi:endonuclease/exonuclease/phosphatase (EEP) superfamily protein YafD|uniref:endonuclease/exonuclease/phosphatase family protein n=1 Tax=Hyphococcus sp. TaxID=2038636 RepID=UPI003D0BBF0B
MCAALLIVSQAGQWLPAADMLNHVLPQLLIFSAIFVATQLGLSIRHRASLLPPLAAACLVIAVAGRMVLPELAAERPSRPDAADKTYRFAVYNVKQRNVAPLEVADWLTHNAFDFAVLLEADADIVTAIALAYPHAVNCLGNRHRCSTVVLSARAPVESEGLAKGDPQNRKTLSAVKTSFCIDGQKLTIVGAHLSRPWPPSAQNRDLKDLARHLASIHDRNVIVAGDFNLTPWSFKFRAFDRKVDLMRITRGLFSWPADRATPPLLPLDHIFVSRSVRATAPETAPPNGSDHRPVVMSFSLMPGGSAPDSACAGSPR